jgi:hypothetical protein
MKLTVKHNKTEIVIEDDGLKANDDVPGGTTTAATYDDVTNPIDEVALNVPIKFLGEVASNHPFPVTGIVSNVK